MSKNSNQILTTTTILTILSIVIAIATAVPSILSLEKPISKIYFQEKYVELNIPKEIDTDEVRGIMIKNKIPRASYELSLKNLGNSQCKKLKVSISAEERISNVSFYPDSSNHPIWVDFQLIEFLNDSSQLNFHLSDLSTMRNFGVVLNFQNGAMEEPKTEMIHDGVNATIVNDLSKVEPWSKLDLFILPLQILAIGIGLTAAISIILLFVKDERLRKGAWILISQLIEVLPILSGAYIVFENVKTISEKEKDKSG